MTPTLEKLANFIHIYCHIEKIRIVDFIQNKFPKDGKCKKKIWNLISPIIVE